MITLINSSHDFYNLLIDNMIFTMYLNYLLKDNHVNKFSKIINMKLL